MSKKTIKRLLENRDVKSIEDICEQYEAVTKTVCHNWGCYHSKQTQVYSRPIYHASLIHHEYKTNKKSVEWIWDSLNTSRLGTIQIKHMCGDDSCFNPLHLKVGTQKENEVEKHYHYFLRHDNESMQNAILYEPAALNSYLELGGIISANQSARLTPNK